jgi:hypothetical protein
VQAGGSVIKEILRLLREGAPSKGVIKMTTKTLNTSSMLLILSGVLLGVAMIYHPDTARPDYAATPAWVPVHVMLGLSALLGLGGLAGLYAAMNLKMRNGGRLAFGLAMLGNMLLTGIMFFVEVSILPVLARNPVYQPLASQAGPLMTGALGNAIGISMLIAAVGFLALAGYLVYTRTISFLNGLLFIGAPLLVFTPPLTPIFGVIGGLLLGSAIVWLGISARIGLAHRSLEPGLRIQDECLAHLGHA